MKGRRILTGSCPDQPGLVARIANWVHEQGGNIVELDEHVDRSTNRFLLRIEADFTEESESCGALQVKLADELGMAFKSCFQLADSAQMERVALFVTKLGHCLHDLLSRYESGELGVEIPLMISNHETFRPVAERHGIPFHYFPMTKENKAEQEARELELLEKENISLVVLARYMQILSSRMIEAYPNKIINIHHSFLPAFAGARPYHRAYDRGVKLIGATAHYVTEDLDEGPIIEQETARASHRDSVSNLIRNGRDLEKIVLARAIRLHLARRVLVDSGRTYVFD